MNSKILSYGNAEVFLNILREGQIIMKWKKFTAALSAAVLAAGAAVYLPSDSSRKMDVNAESSGGYNYAEALQKSMFFYEVQQAGVLPDWNEVSWRGDSMVNDVVPGGWFDAGDHLKFALTNAYSAALLGWGLVEYGDAVDKAGLGELYRNNLQFGLDYLVGCDKGNEIVYMIGEGAFDHVWWGSAEVYMNKYVLKGGSDPRPAYTCQDSCIEGQMAAALATGYMVFKDSSPSLAETYLEHARDLFERADAEKSIGDDTEEHSYYKPSSFYDDLFFAANWLYKATGEQSYLDKATSYIPNLDKEQQSTEYKFSWGHCWDDTTQGGFLLYAQNTGDKEWIEQVRKHLEYWTTGYNGKQVSYTPDGLAWLFQWGSLRHATTTVYLALLASDTIFADDAAAAEKYNTWSKKQMDYCFGDNDLGLSYVLGMGTNPKSFHHRTASGIHDDHWNELGTDGSTAGGEEWQTEYAHVLYGALEGGPNQDGTFTDQIASYQNTEVAIDYNAGFTAALCAMIDDYGGTKLEDFPPTEEPKWAEWEIAAVLNGKGNSYSEIKAWAMNHTAWPARVEKNISFRYFFDVSEVLAAGLSIDDIKVETKSQQYGEGEAGHAVAEGPFKYEGDPTGNTYYAEIKFLDGTAIMPTGQSEHRDEVQFRISIPDAIDGKPTTGAWDSSNDWSYEGIEDATDLKKSDSLNSHITMYVNDILVWGTEPDGSTPQVTEPTSRPQTTTDDVQPTTEPDGDYLWGDADDNGEVNVNDVVTILCYAADESANKLPSDEAYIQADVYKHGDGINSSDAVSVQKYNAKLILSLPESYS